MRASVIGSGVAHVLLVLGLFIVRQPMSIVVPGPDVVQVALIDPSAAITPPPPVETPKPEPETIKPAEEEGVKLQASKPIKPPKPQPSPRPAKQTTAPTLPSAQVGPAGLKAD